jgi:branched-chain amino acid transport system permease protein
MAGVDRGDVTELAQHVVFGLATGAFLLLAAVGFSLVRQVEGFLNIAHAQLISFGAYATWMMNVPFDWPIVPSALAGIALTAVLGLAQARFFYDPIQSYGPDILLITSVGVAFAIQGLIEMFADPGTSLFSLANPEPFLIGSVRVNPYHAGVFVAALATTLAMYLLFTRTRIGRQIRAVSVDRQLAQSRGVALASTSRAVWLAAGATAGMAGVALGLLGTLTTDIAFVQILLIVAVSIFAGFGSLLHLLAAAFVTGLAMDVSVIWIPSTYRSVVPFVIIIVVLLLRRQQTLGLATA